jgi:hypothetical protein
VVTVFSSIPAATRLVGVCATTDVLNPKIGRNATTRAQVLTCLGIVFLEKWSSAHETADRLGSGCVSYLSARRTKAWSFFRALVTEVARMGVAEIQEGEVKEAFRPPINTIQRHCVSVTYDDSAVIPEYKCADHTWTTGRTAY